MGKPFNYYQETKLRRKKHSVGCLSLYSSGDHFGEKIKKIEALVSSESVEKTRSFSDQLKQLTFHNHRSADRLNTLAHSRKTNPTARFSHLNGDRKRIAKGTSSSSARLLLRLQNLSK